MAHTNPKKNKAGLLASLLILLIILIALFVFLRSCTSEISEATPTPSAAPTVTAPPATETPEPSPTPTEQPPSPTPTEQPPTPTPTLTPIDLAGSFQSDTGTDLNLIAEWTAVSSDEEKVTLTVALYVESYSLQYSSLDNGATVVIDGVSHSFITDPIDYDGADGLAKNRLGSISVNLTPDENRTLTVPISVSWAFVGTYSGVDLESISAQDTIVLG
ncbi:MAG TPA: hypothetical protein DC001_03000 [Clostridiales bacterium]|nr:hypothetical protein [Clostridiales bacterium]HBR08803.1 hypothetical protein [Clostridiales bacterium]